jgi:hypothetical protein
MGGQEMNFNGGEGYRRDFKMLCVWFNGGRDFKVTFKNKGIYYLSLNLKRHSLPSKSLHFWRGAIVSL